ncbi:MAG: hypothetical protein COV29_04330 [Candidatus Yanofskybacteria bacterium CG10_big_fil_rev_8_21_14_0_10_36_16]|uniref:Glycoside hydrolase family 5 domain-containing protein n=1 Tax=Candidatus Yanofskybacteria bacterium CG10_big_fil_rev_8_21_14_0_10_36_16 TaxID=1975096 RepID=A0A2J0Q6E3_9BACT|nr:MAG: hypothetical protein COV29_04330 [Candidatus Yanofskybacteria bacterium CG10_big_fil_rev_8_21_14_0_10_36_16]
MKQPAGYYFIILSLVFCFCGSASAKTHDCGTATYKKDFLYSIDYKMCLNGKEYKQIGLNKFDLFFQYLECNPSENCPQKSKAKKALKEMGDHGFKIIRLIGSDFYTKQFYERFFDKDPEIQKQKRAKHKATVDELLNDCEKSGIDKVIWVNVWNIELLADLGGHSLRGGLTDPNSIGFRRAMEYVRFMVENFKDDPRIAGWEVPGNEYDLSANHDNKYGILQSRNEKECKILHEGPDKPLRLCFDDPLSIMPVVRDRSNNFTYDDLAKYNHLMSAVVREIDKNHLIISGHSSVRGVGVTDQQRADDFKKIHSGLEVTSFHSYEHLYLFDVFEKSTKEMSKPGIVGEIGPDASVKPRDLSWTSKRNIEYTKKIIRKFLKSDFSIMLPWAYADDRGIEDESNRIFYLRYGDTDTPLRLFEKANKQIRARLNNN